MYKNTGSEKIKERQRKEKERDKESFRFRILLQIKVFCAFIAGPVNVPEMRTCNLHIL